MMYGTLHDFSSLIFSVKDETRATSFSRDHVMPPPVRHLIFVITKPHANDNMQLQTTCAFLNAYEESSYTKWCKLAMLCASLIMLD